MPLKRTDRPRPQANIEVFNYADYLRRIEAARVIAMQERIANRPELYPPGFQMLQPEAAVPMPAPPAPQPLTIDEAVAAWNPQPIARPAPNPLTIPAGEVLLTNAQAIELQEIEDMLDEEEPPNIKPKEEEVKTESEKKQELIDATLQGFKTGLDSARYGNKLENDETLRAYSSSANKEVQDAYIEAFKKGFKAKQEQKKKAKAETAKTETKKKPCAWTIKY